MDSHFIGSAVTGFNKPLRISIGWIWNTWHKQSCQEQDRLALTGQWLLRTKVQALMKLNMTEGLSDWITSTLFSMF